MDRVRVAVCAAAALVLCAGHRAAAADISIPLNYNWNGLAHPGEGFDPDDPSGFRSIADRALYVDGFTANSLGGAPIVGATGINYTVVTTAGVLDCVHLGNTANFSPATPTQNPPVGTPTRWWDTSGIPGQNATHGAQPAWLPSLDAHTFPQTTSVAPLNIVMDANSSLGVLYHVTNGGGNVDMVLTFTDSSSVTVTLRANDWFGATNPPAAAPGIASQARLGATTFVGANSTDTPAIQTWPTQSLAVTEAVVTAQSLSQAGLGNIAGKTLASITFQNITQPLRGYAIFAATAVTGLGPPANDNCANAAVIVPGPNATDSTRATGATTSGCGVGDTTDVWYRYTATSSGLHEVRTCGAPFDTTLSVHTSCAGAAVACSDNGCGLGSRVQWNAVSGQTYFFRVAGNNGATGQFTLFLDTAAVGHADSPIALNANWNGMVHVGEEGQPDSPSGFRSISDRALHLSGGPGALNGGALVGADFMPYQPVAQAGALDLVHLGRTGAGSPRLWDAAPDGDNMGTQPTWLTILEQTGPQRTNLAAMNAAMGPNTQIGILYNISNNGGAFDATLEFADGTSVTVTLQGPDWYQDQVPPPPGIGVAVQQQLGQFAATAAQDMATTGAPSLNVVEARISTSSLLGGGLGDFTGKRLAGLTFSNPVNGTTAGFAIYAATLRDAVPNFDPVPPIGSGSASPNPAEVRRTVTFRVAVSPGLNPASTGLAVQANLAAIGGSAAQTLFDNGTNGDTTPGDLVFSYAMTIGPNQATGPFSLPFTVSDAQSRTTNGSINLTINPYTWNEQTDGGGDAADLPASHHTPQGSGPLGGIRGSLVADDVDMFEIQICDVGAFTASTVGSATFDTQLFLFHPDGTGVSFSDDTLTPQSTLTSAFVTQPGRYLLAISRYDRDPVDASNQALWIDTPFNIERAPDGPGAANPMTAWTGTTVAAGDYLITLTGACFAGCRADFDGNGAVEPSDVAAFVGTWFTSIQQGTLAGDFDGNGAVEPSDVAAFVGTWFNALVNGC